MTSKTTDKNFDPAGVCLAKKELNISITIEFHSIGLTPDVYNIMVIVIKVLPNSADEKYIPMVAKLQ
jgi:hypothetical protein